MATCGRGHSEARVSCGARSRTWARSSPRAADTSSSACRASPPPTPPRSQWPPAWYPSCARGPRAFWTWTRSARGLNQRAAFLVGSDGSGASHPAALRLPRLLDTGRVSCGLDWARESWSWDTQPSWEGSRVGWRRAKSIPGQGAALPGPWFGVPLLRVQAPGVPSALASSLPRLHKVAVYFSFLSFFFLVPGIELGSLRLQGRPPNR
ncbi:uncharacterized protein LOC104875100 isoform X2 [Fukomys damarensis]|uniref:uncharacterized protein LOC104875100 isoform X2 n=1 Tax=Fukomys damarensis TaxID=885580 RepID=UPI0005401894|nr:uncharacterized protein LOC104875100 isoform X2 [Fukomys damarensis]